MVSFQSKAMQKIDSRAREEGFMFFCAQPCLKGSGLNENYITENLSDYFDEVRQLLQFTLPSTVLLSIHIHVSLPQHSVA
jgi:hypothetical protein